MKTITSHGRKDQIVINVKTDDFAIRFFEILSERLKKSYIFHTETKENNFTFRGSIFRFVWNGWDLFNSFTKGEIEFTTEDEKPFIRHKISFNEAFVIALLFNIIPLFTMKYEPWLSLFVFIIIWLAYSINYFVSIFRFNSYIAETLIQTNETAGYELKSENKPTRQNTIKATST